MATVKPNPNFNAEARATELHDALDGFGKDEDLVIAILTSHNNAQRLQIKDAYKSAFGDDLEDIIGRHFSGVRKDVLLDLLIPLNKYDAKELRSAMKGVGTDDTVLIEIMCLRDNAEIENIKTQYQQDFDRDLEQDLERETSGNFSRLLVAQCNAGRDESTAVNKPAAVEDAKALYEAGEDRWGTDESIFTEILCTRSYAQLKAIFTEYEIVAGTDIEESIRSECRRDLQDGYLAIVQRAKDISSFYAQRMHNTLSGMGTDESALIRIIVSRCEKDMVEVKTDFQNKYDRSLADAIENDCRGDFKTVLIKLIGA